MNKDIELINFKIPKQMKRQFKEICQSRNVTLTSVINSFIADYIKDNRQVSEDDDDDLPLGFSSRW
jgi:antitoxin component of RelBE/YafQ-DinJ toxin-antitoxin module